MRTPASVNINRERHLKLTLSSALHIHTRGHTTPPQPTNEIQISTASISVLKGQFSTVNKATQQHQASVATCFPLGVNTFTTSQALSGGDLRAPGRDDSSAFSSCPNPRPLGPHPSQFPLLLAFWLLIILYREAGRLRADLSPRTDRRVASADGASHGRGTGEAAPPDSPSIAQHHSRIVQRCPRGRHRSGCVLSIAQHHRPASPSITQYHSESPSVAQHRPRGRHRRGCVPSIAQHHPASPSITQYRPASPRIAQHRPVHPPRRASTEAGGPACRVP